MSGSGHKTLMVSLRRGGRQWKRGLKMLVAEVFLGHLNPSDQLTFLRDGNELNCSVSNIVVIDRRDNYERIKALQRARMARSTKVISRGYVAVLLNMSVENLPEELYLTYREQLKVKRALAEVIGVSISSFNHL
jgi:hypothetical protein